MNEDWIEIEGERISLEMTPKLIKKLNLLPIFIRRYLEAKYTLPIIPEKDEQIAFQKEFMKTNGISDKESLTNWLNKNGKSEKEMNNILFNSLRLEIFKKTKFKKKVESIFLERKSDLDRVTYSIIRVKSRAKAVELHMRLNEEESTFPELASTYSEGIENIMHGLIGPVEFANVNPVIREYLKNSSPGQLWPPFEIDSWWIILRIERLLPATLNEAMESRLIQEMYENWIKEKIMVSISQIDNNLIENEIK
tara:strand:- start:109 stop:864 length:756 start_codon:yes stop_codon:yes gene_type:complete